jgi:KH domain
MTTIVLLSLHTMLLAAQVVREGIASNYNTVTQTIECPVDMVGKIIGKHGLTLRELQRTGLGVHIGLDSSIPRDDPTPRLSK